MIGHVPWNTGKPWSEEVRAKISKTHKASGKTFLERGGNGRGASRAEQLVLNCLPKSFIYNYAVALGGKGHGYPSNYKVDFGDPVKKLALEVDGVSHRQHGREGQDKKKEAKLRELGWSVCRISNEEVFHLYTTSKLKGALTLKLKTAR
jgi:hypothetical protein